jgi:hypothetical protein
MTVPLSYSLFGNAFILILELISTRKSEIFWGVPEIVFDLPERSVIVMF